MEIQQKLMKQIDETRYLTAENAWRYRTILRYFYLQYEKLKYWLYKEEILEVLKNHEEFRNYTMDALKQDLDILVNWRNLVPIQDTSRVATVEEFKNKQFRYQLSEYSVEIERLTIRLENLFVENASLEPSLLEKIKEELSKFSKMIHEEDRVVGSWWRDLNNDFRRLNQNYQDYIGDFYSLRAEEMMKTKEFLVYKERFIDYLRDFIKGLQYNVNAIESILRNIEEREEKVVLQKIFAYEKSIPRLDEQDRNEDIYENIHGKWKNLKGWFLGEEGRDSEAIRLFDITNEIIRKITRYASQISESRNSAANRKEEYKKLAEMFLACKDISEAHKLSSLTFGIFSPKHLQANHERRTESINSGIFDEEPYCYVIKPRTRNYREKEKKTPISNHKDKKTEMLEKVMKARQQEKLLVEGYIQNGKIAFENLPVIDAQVRNTLLRWLVRGINAADRVGKTEHGRVFHVIPPENSKRCRVICEDGDFEMPAYQLQFEMEGQE